MGGEESARLCVRGSRWELTEQSIFRPEIWGADEFAAATTLAKAIEKDGGADLILTGINPTIWEQG
jgi:hypothetical protein